MGLYKKYHQGLRGFGGAVAQLGARLTGSQEVTGSIPVSSTKIFRKPPERAAFSFALIQSVLFEPIKLASITFGIYLCVLSQETEVWRVSEKPISALARNLLKQPEFLEF